MMIYMFYRFTYLKWLLSKVFLLAPAAPGPFALGWPTHYGRGASAEAGRGRLCWLPRAATCHLQDVDMEYGELMW